MDLAWLHPGNGISCYVADLNLKLVDEVQQRRFSAGAFEDS